MAKGQGGGRGAGREGGGKCTLKSSPHWTAAAAMGEMVTWHATSFFPLLCKHVISCIQGERLLLPIAVTTAHTTWSLDLA